MSKNMFLMNHHELSVCSSQDTQGSTQPQRTLTAPTQEGQCSHPGDVDRCWQQAEHRLVSLCAVAASKSGEASPSTDGNTVGQMDKGNPMV